MEERVVGPLSEVSFSVSQVSSIPTLDPMDMFLPLLEAYEGIYIFPFFISIPTGTEALFAALAHFPVSAVQIAFTLVVFPCLLLAYSGQASYLMVNKEHVNDAFYRSIPGLS